MKRSTKIACYVAGSIVITVVALAVMPELIRKLSIRQYRSGYDTSDIDFDDMGPEIVDSRKSTESM